MLPDPRNFIFTLTLIALAFLFTLYMAIFGLYLAVFVRGWLG